jgi:hypothetical protein
VITDRDRGLQFWRWTSSKRRPLTDIQQRQRTVCARAREPREFVDFTVDNYALDLRRCVANIFATISLAVTLKSI